MNFSLELESVLHFLHNVSACTSVDQIRQSKSYDTLVAEPTSQARTSENYSVEGPKA